MQNVKRIAITSLFFLSVYNFSVKVNQINVLNYDFYLYIEKINLFYPLSYDDTLKKGLMIDKKSLHDNFPFIIMGHSGIGKNVYFNNLYKLENGDTILLKRAGIISEYRVIDKVYFKKKSGIDIIYSDAYLYLITCSIVDFDTQIAVICEKIQ